MTESTLLSVIGVGLSTQVPEGWGFGGGSNWVEFRACGFIGFWPSKIMKKQPSFFVVVGLRSRTAFCASKICFLC